MRCLNYVQIIVINQTDSNFRFGRGSLSITPPNLMPAAICSDLWLVFSCIAIKEEAHQAKVLMVGLMICIGKVQTVRTWILVYPFPKFLNNLI